MDDIVDIVDFVHDSHVEDDIVVQEQNDQTLLLTEHDLIMDIDHHPQVDNHGFFFFILFFIYYF